MAIGRFIPFRWSLVWKSLGSDDIRHENEYDLSISRWAFIWDIYSCWWTTLWICCVLHLERVEDMHGLLDFYCYFWLQYFWEMITDSFLEVVHRLQKGNPKSITSLFSNFLHFPFDWLKSNPVILIVLNENVMPKIKHSFHLSQMRWKSS